ncbi:MAG TPA: nucleoside-diphosphate sugar epimerase/dehydratase [Verrucomicrobiae bacterium]|jgi:FlaA1/EpsC-like NDP-sugar epimerase
MHDKTNVVTVSASQLTNNGLGTRNRTKRVHLSLFVRRLIIVAVSTCTLVACRWLAYQLRFDFVVPPHFKAQLYEHGLWVVALQLGCLFVFRQFSGIYKYFSLTEVRHLAYAMGLAGLSLYIVRYLGFGYSPPLGVILIQSLLAFIALGALRSAWRMVHEELISNKNRDSVAPRNVAIIGAGDVGASLVRELRARPNLGLVPVAFYDDAHQKWGSRIHDVPVVGPPEQIQSHKDSLGLAQVIIAMPSCTAKRLGEIIVPLQKAHLKYVTVPSIDQLTSGHVRVSQLRPVKIEDLLGRVSIDLRVDQIGSVLKGRTVMVTGAGGSIGSELCRQVAAFGPRKLLLVDQSEVQLFPIEQELIKLGCGGFIVPAIADILDRQRMKALMQRHLPAIIFHAAAHKHVGMMEIQPGEAIKNNALGTSVLADLALEYLVERFVMISTDKAVNPTSVMGASKRLAEVFIQALALEPEDQTRFDFAPEKQSRTKFVAVRFGNVLGSSGSVVPIFERQIAEGGPITVTHPDVVRFFMTIPEAVGLVLQSCAQGESGDIFFLDMGKPIKIVDLARQMVRLSGLESDSDIEIKFTGLKPGEKLYEELAHLRSNCVDTAHPRIKRLTSMHTPLEDVRVSLSLLTEALHSASPDELKWMLKNILPEYTPSILHANQCEGATISTGHPAFTNTKAEHAFFAIQTAEAANRSEWAADST